MRSRVAGDVAERKVFLEQNGVTIPPTNSGIANLADYILQGGVTRNKVPPRKRIAEVKTAQKKWIGQRVSENGTGKTGIVSHLLIRRAMSIPFSTDTRDRDTFLAVVHWDCGGHSAGMTIRQLSLVNDKTKTLTKASP